MNNFKYFTLVPNASSQHLQHRRVLRGLSGGGGGARHRCAPLPVGNAHVGAAGNEELDEVKAEQEAAEDSDGLLMATQAATAAAGVAAPPPPGSPRATGGSSVVQAKAKVSDPNFLIIDESSLPIEFFDTLEAEEGRRAVALGARRRHHHGCALVAKRLVEHLHDR